MKELLSSVCHTIVLEKLILSLSYFSVFCFFCVADRIA